MYEKKTIEVVINSPPPPKKRGKLKTRRDTLVFSKDFYIWS
jgi:hypothetical protein